MFLLLIGVMVAASVALLSGRVTIDPTMRAIEERVLTEVAEGSDRPRPWFIKALNPMVSWNVKLRLYQRKNALMDEKLVAGKVVVTAAEFFALKQIMALIGLGAYLSVRGFHQVDLLWLAICTVMGWVLPDVWLRQRIGARHRSISRDLPEVVDLLRLCVDAGADFMSALQRVVRDYRPCAVREELNVVLQEMRVGKRRREAFRSMAQRVQLADVTAFVRAIIQADRMGTGMSQALMVMAEDTRLRRYHAAERFAQKAPLKMLIPLVLIMLCALMMVAGPVLLEFTRGQLFPSQM